MLEIGCGLGVAGTFVCERLDGGRLNGVDRSTKMIEAARRRNASWVEARLIARLEELDLGELCFDVVFAVRVGLFDRDPERAHTLVEPWLAPGARVVAFFDRPGGR